MKIDPIQDFVLVRRDEAATESAGGLALVMQRPCVTGIVVAVGPGKPKKRGGVIIPVDVQVGERVLFDKNMGTEVLSEGEKLLVLREPFLIMAVPPTVSVELVIPPPPPIPDHLKGAAPGAAGGPPMGGMGAPGDDYDFSDVR